MPLYLSVCLPLPNASACADVQASQLHWDVALETSAGLDFDLRDPTGKDLLHVGLAGVSGTAQTDTATAQKKIVAKLDAQVRLLLDIMYFITTEP